MPDQDKKLRSTEKATDKKPHGISMRDYSDLKKLQSLLNVQSRNQQLPAIYFESVQSSVTRACKNVKSKEQEPSGQWQESTEAAELEKFREWVIQAPSTHFLRILICLRLLIRDPCYQEMLHSLGEIENLAQYTETVANSCLNYGEEQHNVDKLVNMTSELLRLLCAESRVKEQVKMYEGVPVLLSLLHSDHIKLLWSIVWILVQVCEDLEIGVEIQIWGGIKQLLHILQGERNLFSDHSSVRSLSSANAAGTIQDLHSSDDLSPEEMQENTFSLQAACCAVITELVLNETNAYQVVQANGIYTIAKLFLPNKERNAEKASLLQSPEISLQYGKISACFQKEDVLKQIAESIESMNQNKVPTKYIGNYAILEHLGSGAFGSVYKIRKHNGQNLLAMKEVSLHNPAFGKDKKDRDSSVRNIVSELTIIREQLYHPNVVRYYRTFLENDRLYIVMELIEGVPLGEHFHSLKEKQQQFTENRIWHIFIQLCLALHYLHKEKRIVHRDVTLNNVMLGDKDKITITDFGLAKQKQENCKLASVVGTVLYSCPEVVKSEPYGEKADVWAAGCILYQMATLNPPFYSTNMLSLATKIVGAMYEPMPEGLYSEKVSFTIEKNYDKLSLHSSSNGAASCKSQFSENTDLPVDSCQSACGKYEEGTYEEILVEDHRTIEKGMFSELDAELDILDYSSSSNSNIIMAGLRERRFGKALSTFITGIIKQSFSTSGRQPKIRDYVDSPGSRLRPASAGIAVSQRKVRQISDPIQQILIQLYKIIFITQLPRALQCNLKRRIIERFKKSLFSQQSNPCNLKSEKKKAGCSPTEKELTIISEFLHVPSKSPENTVIGKGSENYFLVISALGETEAKTELVAKQLLGMVGTSDMAEGVTYEQLQTLIKEVLEESDCYSFSSNRCLYFPKGTKNYPAKEENM